MARYSPQTALPADEMCRRLAMIERLHDEWGSTDAEHIDQLDLWERFGLALSGEEPA